MRGSNRRVEMKKIWYLDYEKVPKGWSCVNTYHRKVVAEDVWTAIRKAKLGVRHMTAGGKFLSAIEVDEDRYPIPDGERYLCLGYGDKTEMVVRANSPYETLVDIPDDL